MLLHFLIYLARVLSAVECLVYATLKEQNNFLLINYYYSVIFPFGCLSECSRCVCGCVFFVVVVVVFWLYSGGLQIVCSSDIVIAEYLRTVTGCDQSRNTRLGFVFVLQFTVRQNVLMLFLDPCFHFCSPELKNISLFFEIN